MKSRKPPNPLKNKKNIIKTHVELVLNELNKRLAANGIRFEVSPKCLTYDTKTDSWISDGR